MTAQFFQTTSSESNEFLTNVNTHISVVDVSAVSEKLSDRQGLEERLAKETQLVAALDRLLMVAASGFGVVVLRLG